MTWDWTPDQLQRLGRFLAARLASSSSVTRSTRSLPSMPFCLAQATNSLVLPWMPNESTSVSLPDWARLAMAIWRPSRRTRLGRV